MHQGERGAGEATPARASISRKERAAEQRSLDLREPPGVLPPRAGAYFALNQSPEFSRVAIGNPGPPSRDGTSAVSTAIRGRSVRGGGVLRVPADRSRRGRGRGRCGAKARRPRCASAPGTSCRPHAPLSASLGEHALPRGLDHLLAHLQGHSGNQRGSRTSEAGLHGSRRPTAP